MATLPSKEMEELRRQFRPGFTVQQMKGSTHFAVINPDGEQVRNTKNQPLRIPSTPHGGRQTKNVENSLRTAGVLKEAPKPRGAHLQTDAVQERRLASMRESTRIRAQRRQATANELFERINKVVEPLGGFEQRGMKFDLARIGAKIARESPESGSGRLMTPDLLIASISRVAGKHWVEPRYQEIWTQLCERLESAPDMTEEFFALVREVRGLPEGIVIDEQLSLPSGDWPFVVELLPINLLFLDHSYQRPPDWPFIRKNAASFDERLVGTIDVAQRKQGAVYAILDGQQRYEMMRLVGKTSVWASVYQGLDTEAEARFFLHKNKDKKAIHAFYTWRARMTAGDPTAKTIEKIVKKHGFEIAITNSAKGGSTTNHISAIAALEEVHHRKTPHGVTALDPTLAMLKEATYGRRSGQHANLIRGLGTFFSIYPQNGQPLNTDQLRNVLVDRGPEWLISTARDEARETHSVLPTRLVRVLVDEYNRGLPRGERLPAPPKRTAR